MAKKVSTMHVRRTPPVQGRSSIVTPPPKDADVTGGPQRRPAKTERLVSRDRLPLFASRVPARLCHPGSRTALPSETRLIRMRTAEMPTAVRRHAGRVGDDAPP